ncbi:MAG: VWA domain-containing protein [Acidobacteria bacterium]|nr:VWA domain-containing protein [Acidobacteriota bacterium]
MTRRLCIILLAASLSGRAGFPQASNSSQDSRAPQESNPQFFASVDVVNVLVTATDKKGRFITNLERNDFQIYEDGKPQQVANFNKQTNLPLVLAFLIDTSSSVSVKLSFEKEAATNFIYSIMREKDRALLIEFDTGVTLLQDLTSSANEIVRKIARLTAGGGTALYDAIYEVTTKKLQNLPDRKVIVILSDGADENSKSTLQEGLEKLRQMDIAVYAISTSSYGASGDQRGDKALAKLAEETGGKAYFPYTPAQMEQYFDLINQELRSQYNLAYESTNRKRDGSYRTIEVRTSRDDVRLRHKKGYVARLQAN